MERNLDAITSRVCRDHCWQKTVNGIRHLKEPLDDFKIQAHLRGDKTYGACPITPGESTTRLALFDLDAHKGESTWDQIKEVAREIKKTAALVGLNAVAFRSSGGKGIHLFFLWDSPQDAFSVCAALSNVLHALGYQEGTDGVHQKQIEIFPKQYSVPVDGCGSMFVLPYAGKSESLSAEDGWVMSTDVTFIPHQEKRNGSKNDKAPPPNQDTDARGSDVLRAPDDSEPPNNLGPATESASGSQPAQTLRGSGSTVTDGGAGTTPQPAQARHSDGDQICVDGQSDALLRSALDAIPNEGDGLPYDQWRNVMFGIHHATGGSDAGFDLAERFSNRSGKHNHIFFSERVWPYIGKRDANPITRQTIYHLARQHGWQEDVLADFDVVGPDGPAVERTDGTGRSGTVSRFPALSLDEFLVRSTQAWRVKDVLPLDEVGVAFGQSGSGKSFFILDLAAAVARGIPWRGNVTTRCRVVYLAAEGARGFQSRVRAYCHRNDILPADLDLRVIRAVPNLMLIDDALEVARSVLAVGPVGLIVIDTLAQVTPGADENSTKDMGVMLLHCRKIAEATKAMVLLIHHSGKDESKGTRGSTLIPGQAAVIIEISRLGDGSFAPRVAKISKMKDGQEGQTYGFKLKEIEFDLDDEGDALSSCVVEPIESVQRATHRPPQRSQGGANEERVLAVLDELAGAGGTLVPQSVAYQELIDTTHTRTLGQRKSNIVRACQGLIDKGVLVELNAFITRKT